MNEAAQYWYNKQQTYWSEYHKVKKEYDKLDSFQKKIGVLEISDALVNNVATAIFYFENGGCILSDGEIVGGRALYEALSSLIEASDLYEDLVTKICSEKSPISSKMSELWGNYEYAKSKYEYFVSGAASLEEMAVYM